MLFSGMPFLVYFLPALFFVVYRYFCHLDLQSDRCIPYCGKNQSGQSCRRIWIFLKKSGFVCKSQSINGCSYFPEQAYVPERVEFRKWYISFRIFCCLPECRGETGHTWRSVFRLRCFLFSVFSWIISGGNRNPEFIRILSILSAVRSTLWKCVHCAEVPEVFFLCAVVIF